MGEPWETGDDDQRREWLRRGIVPLDYPEPVAADYPDLLDIVEQRVKPARERLGSSTLDRAHRARWWQFANDRPLLRTAIAGLQRVLATSRVSENLAFAFLPTGAVYSERLVVFPFESWPLFCVLQARTNEVWVRFFGSSLEDRLTYTPSDCFETFPLPRCWTSGRSLETQGREYYDFRAGLMARRGEGLTRTYNRFHDPHERDPEIVTLRSLHAAMDRAVLDAYGWRDIPTDCEFLLDYEIDEEEWGARKKPYRYRWPDEVRDEVLARLLEFNAERAAEEARSGKAATTAARGETERPSARTSTCRTTATRAAEPRPLQGTSDD